MDSNIINLPGSSKAELLAEAFRLTAKANAIMNIPPAKAGGFADAPEGAQSATRADGYFGSTSAVSTAPISSRAG